MTETTFISISPPTANPRCLRRFGLVAVLACFGLMIASGASAQGELCDNSYQDCRAKIIKLIQDENDRIDVSFWFMDDWIYRYSLIAAKNRGVKVRVILDLRGDTNYPANKAVRDALIAAGIPIRHKTTAGINHWKMMLYGGQQKVHFSAANFSDGSYSPVKPYKDYVDEAVYFTSDAETVHTFMMKYDDLWMDTTNYANLANVSVLERAYPTYDQGSGAEFSARSTTTRTRVSAIGWSRRNRSTSRCSGSRRAPFPTN